MNRLAGIPLSLGICLPALFAACSGGGDAAAPPEIHYGEDLCRTCGMIISDERFASGVVVRGADDRFDRFAFDDIGCLLEFERERPGAVIASFVHDYQSRGWLAAEAATFLSSDRLHTPMASGLLAVADAEAAAALLERYPGETLSLARLRARPAERR